MKCIKCGFELREGSLFCGNCGEKYEQNNEEKLEECVFGDNKNEKAESGVSTVNKKGYESESSEKKRISRKTGLKIAGPFAIILVAGILLLNNPVSNKNKADENVNNTLTVSEEITEPEENVIVYNWVKEPFFEADDVTGMEVHRYFSIDGYNDLQLNYEKIPFVSFSDYMGYGVLDYNGDIVVDNLTEKPYVGRDQRILACKGNEYMEIKSYDNESCICDLIFENVYEISGTAPEWRLLYDANKEKTLILHSDGSAYDYREYVITPVILGIETEGEYYSYYELDYSKNGLLSKGELVLDCIYPASTGYADGLVGFMDSDGKWGYVNEEGETVIPFEYDTIVESEYSFENNLAYTPSFGYVTLRKGDGYGFFDVEGNEIIPVGTFEGATPVYDNKAWVKSGGKWGIIEICK